MAEKTLPDPGYEAMPPPYGVYAPGASHNVGYPNQHKVQPGLPGNIQINPPAYPGQTGGYYGQTYDPHIQSTNVIISTASNNNYYSFWGQNPVSTSCPNCRSAVLTTVDYEIGAFTWVVVLVLFGLGFMTLITWLVCCVPCCISSCKDARHSCPNCHHTLGYHRHGF